LVEPKAAQGQDGRLVPQPSVTLQSPLRRRLILWKDDRESNSAFAARAEHVRNWLANHEIFQQELVWLSS